MGLFESLVRLPSDFVAFNRIKKLYLDLEDQYDACRVYAHRMTTCAGYTGSQDQRHLEGLLEQISRAGTKLHFQIMCFEPGILAKKLTNARMHCIVANTKEVAERCSSLYHTLLLDTVNKNTQIVSAVKVLGHPLPSELAA
jgi:hypothetical protein